MSRVTFNEWHVVVIRDSHEPTSSWRAHCMDVLSDDRRTRDAKDALARGNRSAARGKLQDVIGYCVDQSGKKIAAAAATTLVTDAQYVLNTM